MKNRMPTRKSLGKESSFLSSFKRKYTKFSQTRSLIKHPNPMPNSTKIGKSSITTARRNISPDTLHKRDARSTRMVKYGTPHKSNTDKFNVIDSM